MSIWGIIRTIFEVALVSVTLWAVFHEDRLADFEERVIARLRRRKFKVIHTGAKISSTCMPSAARER